MHGLVAIANLLIRDAASLSADDQWFPIFSNIRLVPWPIHVAQRDNVESMARIKSARRNFGQLMRMVNSAGIATYFRLLAAATWSRSGSSLTRCPVYSSTMRWTKALGFAAFAHHGVRTLLRLPGQPHFPIPKADPVRMGRRPPHAPYAQ